MAEYAMRLRQLAAYCNFGANLEKEICSQLVADSGIYDFQRKCCRTDSLTLKLALELAIGYERVVSNFNSLLAPTKA